jgi:hypothetical protein
LSSPTVNVLWGLVNLAVAYTLLVMVGRLELQDVAQAAVAFAGFGLGAVGVARSLARLQPGAHGNG